MRFGDSPGLFTRTIELFCELCLQNKSAFLCGVMKTYRQREKQGSKVQESTKGPDEAKIKVTQNPDYFLIYCLCAENTDYSLLSDVQTEVILYIFKKHQCYLGKYIHTWN